MVDWGTVPAWVGAIFTGSSVLAALSYFIADRRDERKSLVRLVAYRAYTEHRPGGVTATIAVENNSGKPIYNVSGELRRLSHTHLNYSRSLLSVSDTARELKTIPKHDYATSLSHEKVSVESEALIDFSGTRWSDQYYEPRIYLTDANSNCWRVRIRWDGSVRRIKRIRRNDAYTTLMKQESIGKRFTVLWWNIRKVLKWWVCRR